jgi:tRNA A-37 threonylcarbamoyl transferase component Bud32
MAVLVPTGRDPDRPAALAPTQRPDGPDAADMPSSSRLPDGYHLVCWLDVSGASEIDRVASVRRRRLGKPRILKLYRLGIELDPAVHRAWRSISGVDTHVVRLRDAGTVGGRAFEVMDDVGDRVGGDFAPPTARRMTLRDLLADHPGGLPEAEVVDLVRQLGSALDVLGQARLAHLDLRPDNVLVTRRADETRGWHATLVDFGLAVPVLADVTWDVARPSSAYLAPELLLAKTVTAATDWWSLGILAAELATGDHPLLGLDQRTVQYRLAGDDIPVPDGLPDRLVPLVQGLVAAGARWGAAEVADWAAGTALPPPPPPHTSSERPFVFAGQEFRHVPRLMSHLQERWDEAAAVLFGPDADRWDELAAWLPQFDRPGFAADRIVAHVERLGDLLWSADARLLVLLRQADPGLPPAYRDVPLDREGIRRPDVVEDARFVDAAEDLWRWRLLTELDGAAGARGYRDVDELWRRLDTRWRAVAGVLRDNGGPLQSYLATYPVRERRARLLRVATDERFRAQLRHDLARIRAHIVNGLGTPLARFEELAAMVLPPPRSRRRRHASVPDADELVGLLMLHLVSPMVELDVEDESSRRRLAAATEAMRTIAWRRRERWRELERPVAMGWAAAAMGIVFIAFAALLVGVDAVPPRSLSLATDDAISRAWGFLVVGLAGQTACEMWLAATIGAPYHRDHSLSMIFLRLAGRAGRRFGTGFLPAAVFLVAGLCVAAAALAVLLVAPYALMAPALVVHLWSARRRHDRWRAAHDELRAGVLETPIPMEERS